MYTQKFPVTLDQDTPEKEQVMLHEDESPTCLAKELMTEKFVEGEYAAKTIQPPTTLY